MQVTNFPPPPNNLFMFQVRKRSSLLHLARGKEWSMAEIGRKFSFLTDPTSSEKRAFSFKFVAKS